jgi:hypothetical protein
MSARLWGVCDTHLSTIFALVILERFTTPYVGNSDEDKKVLVSMLLIIC